MGTGSYGGGGSGGVRATSGAVRSSGGRLQSTLPPLKRVEQEVRAIFQQLPREYVNAYLQSPLIQGLYKALFRLNVELRQNHSWDYIERTYGVRRGPGCLKQLAKALLNQRSELNEKIRLTGISCIEGFLIRVVDNDPRIYLHGDADEVIARIDGAVFDATSAHFLRALLGGMLRRERERLPEVSERQIDSVCEDIANRVVARYAADRAARGEVRFRELIEVFASDPEMFIKGIRQ